MPINRNALIRYRTIDKCLQNRRRKWTIESLIEACNAALFEYGGDTKGISLRTIRMDITAMRGEQLGYNAPIVVVDKKYYTYEDDDYSITNSNISSQELAVLQEATMLLQQVKGFANFGDMNDIINRLEDKIYTQVNHKQSVIDFEKNELLTGIHWLDILYKAIINEQTLNLTYQSFTAREAQTMVVFPYLLKEYRNRWFILCQQQGRPGLYTLAIDRIKDIAINETVRYKNIKNFDPISYFKPIVGVTRQEREQPMLITFWAEAKHAPYIITKPIHSSQQVKAHQDGGTIFTIEVFPNLELEREILGFAEGVKVLSPNSFVRRIKSRAVKLAVHYQEPAT